MLLKAYEPKGLLVGLVHFHYHGGYDPILLEFLSEKHFELVDLLALLKGDVLDVDIAFVLLVGALGFVLEGFDDNRAVAKCLSVELFFNLIGELLRHVLHIPISKGIPVVIGLEQCIARWSSFSKEGIKLLGGLRWIDILHKQIAFLIVHLILL